MAQYTELPDNEPEITLRTRVKEDLELLKYTLEGFSNSLNMVVKRYDVNKLERIYLRYILAKLNILNNYKDYKPLTTEKQRKEYLKEIITNIEDILNN